LNLVKELSNNDKMEKEEKKDIIKQKEEKEKVKKDIKRLKED
jgi:hypothetical protein